MKKIFIASLLLIMILLLGSQTAFADFEIEPSEQVQLHNPLGDSNRDLGSLLTSILDMAVNFIITPILVLMIIVGAWQMLVSAGSPDKFNKGKMTIVYAVIGFAIILLAKGIGAVIQYVLGINA